MPIYKFKGMCPRIGNGTWVAPSAEIIGDVEIGENCFIGFGAIIRGDFGAIRIGNETMVEECVVIHTWNKMQISNRVIIGHMAMIHDAIIEDDVLIGMKAMICEYSSIGKGSIVAEQSLVKKNTSVAPGKIIAGSPAKVIGDVSKRHKERIASGHKAYIELINSYIQSFKQI